MAARARVQALPVHFQVQVLYLRDVKGNPGASQAAGPAWNSFRRRLEGWQPVTSGDGDAGQVTVRPFTVNIQRARKNKGRLNHPESP